jgi:hypothetical protein
LQSHPSRIEVVDFQSPDLARIHPAMTLRGLCRLDDDAMQLPGADLCRS